MLKQIALTAAAVAALGLSNEAHAELGYQDSPPVQNYTFCGGATAAQVGYYADPGVFPRTGDAGYIRVIARGGCAIDTVGFDLHFPYGVTPWVTAENPVFCMRGMGTQWNNIANLGAANGACLQKPTSGNSGGLFYGWSKLNPGEWVEFRVPVRYQKRAPGVLTTVMSSVFAPIVSVINLDVGYKADFSNYAGSSDSSGTVANVKYGMIHYWTTGQVVIEYGSGTFDHETTPVTADAQYWQYTDITADLPGVTPGTTVVWRPRIATAFGTFWGETQTINMNPGSIVPIFQPPVACRRFGCR